MAAHGATRLWSRRVRNCNRAQTTKRFQCYRDKGSVSKFGVGDEDESAFATNEGFDSTITLADDGQQLPS
jgi:hypothetical protein